MVTTDCDGLSGRSLLLPRKRSPRDSAFEERSAHFSPSSRDNRPAGLRIRMHHVPSLSRIRLFAAVEDMSGHYTLRHAP